MVRQSSIVDIDPEALEAHRFEYDTTAIDKPLADLLRYFYTLSDDRENASAWADCFCENAVMKKAATEVEGRGAIAKMNENSWKGQKSRQHIVEKVFPFHCGQPKEVMLHGKSKYVYDDETRGEMAWAARIEIERQVDGSIQISHYHIYPSSPPKAQ